MRHDAPPPAAPSSDEAGHRLADLAAAYWEATLAADPVEATLLGEHRFDDRLPDVTPAGRAREIARLHAADAALRAIDPARLPAADRVTWGALEQELTAALAYRECALDDWTVDPRRGPQVTFPTLAGLQRPVTVADGRAMLARWRSIAAHVDQQGSNLRGALASGKVAPRAAVQRVIAQLDALLAKPDAAWPLLAEPLAMAHPGWPAADVAAFRDGMTAAVRDGVRPAFARYRDVIAHDVLPRARDDAHDGLAHVPGGAACYRRLIRAETSLDLAPEDVHRLGLEEVARVREEMRALGRKLLGSDDLAVIQGRLRGGEPALFFRSRDEIEHTAALALARAQAALPRLVGKLPSTPCEVRRIPDYEERDSTIAYYRQLASDGSRPGVYWVNTYAPETRPRYEAEVLAFHESVPGHHTQIALARERIGVPEFRKHADVNAFVEGWALYVEGLADEAGLYSSDLDRMGMLSFDAWRASRLVVDTGLHALGWTRRQAVDYMRQNTVLAENNIENEVDRYITTPAQALGYKLGQREIRALRRDAEARLGARFDLRRFHDAVLGQGGIPLSVLRREIEAWIAAEASAPGL